MKKEKKKKNSYEDDVGINVLRQRADMYINIGTTHSHLHHILQVRFHHSAVSRASDNGTVMIPLLLSITARGNGSELLIHPC